MPAERKLPVLDATIVDEWERMGRNAAAVARKYGCGESTVRKRIHRKTWKEIPLRKYKMLKHTDEQLYNEWRNLGCVRGSMLAVAYRTGEEYNAVRKAIARHRAKVEAEFN